MRTLYKVVAAALTGTALAGCALGSNFEPPAAPDASYSTRPLPETTASADGTAGAAQRFMAGEAVAGEWWTLFQSDALNALIAEALRANPDIEAAEASLRQAQEIALAERNVFFPDVEARGGLTRQKSFNSFGGGPAVQTSPYTIATGSVAVSYSPDLFGGTRRYVESFQARAESARFQKEAAYLALTSNLVAVFVQEAALSAQVDATGEILGSQTQQLDVLRRQLDLGGIPEVQVLEQESAVAQTRASLPPLQKQLAQTRHRLLALAGRYPNQDTGQSIDLASLTLPQDLPLSLPSQLVAQRPDIRAAEATLRAASADIGVATAYMFPSWTITGSLGTSAGSIEDLFSAGTGIWSIGANLLQPIFRGGELLHRKRAAVAAYDAAAAQYRSTVLNAFRDVADVLRALELDAAALAAQVDAERAAARNLEIAKLQLETGGTSFLSFLNAQRNFQQAHIALVQAQANRFVDTAALFVALGGGWQAREIEAVGVAAAE